MVKLTIDGVIIEAAEGKTILEAALDAGIYIPNLCYMKGLEPWGGCRLCVVKVNGTKGMPTACTTKAADGMVVENDVEEVNNVRRMICQMLIANHPADCLQCPANQRCELQRIAAHLGVRSHRLRSSYCEQPIDASNPAYVRDLSRCIMCSRCVRTCQEQVMVGAIDIGFRGIESRVSAPNDGPISESPCTSCGCCVQACPVGALRPKEEALPPTRRADLVCPYCGVGCVLDVGIRENRIVEVLGKEETSPNEGFLCVKGRFGLDFVSRPDRLTTPLIRRNGELEEASWEEALDFAASKLGAIKDEHGPGAIGCLSSAKTTNEENFAMMRLARAVIGTNNVDHCARLCHSSTVAGLAATLGSGAMTNSMQETRLSDVILVTGSNTTSCHPVFGSMMMNAVKMHGVKLIVADPREIDLAKVADIHMRQRNGTDVAWLMGVQHIIVREGWHDMDYINERCEGWDEYKKSLEFFTPEKAEELSGIPKEQLSEAAKLFATGGRGAIYFSMGITQHTHGVDNVKACANLAMITGNLGFTGGGVNPLRGQSNVQGACDMGALPNVFSGYQKVTDEALRAKFAQGWGIDAAKMDAQVGQTVTTMVEGCGGQIKALYIMGENPMVSDPNLNHVEEQIGKLDLLVVQDIFLTETAQMADVVLPGVAFAEKTGTYTNTERRVQLGRAALTPPAGARQDYEILAEMARRLGSKTFPATPEALNKEIRELTPSYHGMTYERLAEGGLRWPCPSEDHAGTPILHVGKFVRGKGLLTPLAYRPSAEEPDKEYPMLLSTGRMLEHFHTGSMSRRSRVLDTLVPNAFAEIHPSDAKNIGVKDGEMIRVTTRRGTIETHAQVTERVARGSLFIPFHFAEAAANRLTNDALDPVAKIPEFKVCAARIEKVT